MSKSQSDQAMFRYLRMQAKVGDILSSSSSKAMCALVHERWVAVGLSSGEVIVANMQGHVQSQWRAHATPVNALSVDESGGFVASCSNDGNVVVRHVGGTTSETPAADPLETHRFDQPLTCLNIDPAYASRSEKMFCAGGPKGQLLLNKKSWYTQRDSVMHQGEGAVIAVAWRETLVAWANERGVKIVDVQTEEKVTFVERPAGEGAGCTLLWEADTSSLLIGWTRTVQVLEVCLVASDLSPDAEPRRAAQITRRWEIEKDCTLCGVVPFDVDSVAVLSFVRVWDGSKASLGEEGSVGMPEMQIRNRDTGEVLLVPDGLPVAGFEKHAPENYSLLVSSPLRDRKLAHLLTGLICLASRGFQTSCLLPMRRGSHLRWRRRDSLVARDPPMMYVVTPKELLVVKVRDLDDQVSAALREHRYRDALGMAQRHEAALRKTRLPDVIQQYLEDLLHHEKYDKVE